MQDMPRPRPPHLQRQVTQHGRVAWYVRIGRGPRTRIRAPFGTPEFDAEYQAAIAGNPRLRKAGAEAGFAALAAELPASEWRRLRVNPADESAARRLFPMAEVEGEPTIAGGLRAEADGGRIAVDNSLEARLETAWPDLLPGLIRSIDTESSDHRPAA